MLTKEEYEAKRQARYERLLAASQKAEKESESRLNHAHSMASIIPFGQPILVGHYSEGRDRRYRATKEEGVFSAYYNKNAGEFVANLRKAAREVK